MRKSKIMYQAYQEVFRKHFRSNEWVMYADNLTIYDRKTYPVVLKLKNEVHVSFVEEVMEEKKYLKAILCRMFLEN